MFKNFDGLAALLLSIWLVAAVLSSHVTGLWVFPLLAIAVVAAGGFLHQMEWC